jgi:hypothetical protein
MDLLAKQRELRRSSARLREQFEDSRVQFLLTELDTATMFCNVAKSSDDPQKVSRNLQNAVEGYETVLKHKHDARFDERSKSEFDSKLAHLQSLLKELGQAI